MIALFNYDIGKINMRYTFNKMWCGDFCETVKIKIYTVG